MGDADSASSLRLRAASGVVHRPPARESFVEFSYLFEPSGYARICARCRVRRLIGQAGWTTSDAADLEAEILLRVVKGLRRYDPTRGRPEQLVAQIVKSAARDLLRRRHSAKRIRERAQAPLEEFEDSRSTNEDLRLDLTTLLATLPTRLQQDAQELLNGISKSELALNVDLSRSSIHRDIELLRIWLSRAGIDQYRPPTKKRNGDTHGSPTAKESG